MGGGGRGLTVSDLVYLLLCGGGDLLLGGNILGENFGGGEDLEEGHPHSSCITQVLPTPHHLAKLGETIRTFLLVSTSTRCIEMAGEGGYSTYK